MAEERKGVSGWWRAATIALLVLASIAAAAGASMFEQFKAQIQHVNPHRALTVRVCALVQHADGQ